MSTFMPVHLPWLSTVMKPAMPPTATPQTRLPRALTTSRSLPAKAGPVCEIAAKPAAIANTNFFIIISRFLSLMRHQPVDRTSFPGLAPVSSPFSKIGTPEQTVIS